ncbi:conserved hypothetical protein [Beggiatoa sp. PS]|nr:conserved hypothetical protein [Beggiatoa sp. PS]
MGKSKGRLKVNNQNNNNRLTVEQPPDYNQMVPLFSLERVQEGDYCFSKLDRDNKAAFAESIFKRRAITWNEIQQKDRHKLGYEKISISSIKVSVPRFITEDQHNLLAFRFNGKKPMIGYRIKNIFYVLWFDHDFSVYDHGN